MHPMEPIVFQFNSISPRARLVVTDDRETSSPNTDDVEFGLEVDGVVVVAAAFDVMDLPTLRDALTKIIDRPLPEPDA